jgi:hypothetical protein
MPPPHRTTNPLREAADFFGWLAYVSTMGGGIPDLRLLFARPLNGISAEAVPAPELPPEPIETQEHPPSARGQDEVPKSAPRGVLLRVQRDYDAERIASGSF